MRHITLIIAVLALAIAAPAIAGKGGNGNGGGGGSSDSGSPPGKPGAYSPSLGVSWPQTLSSNTSSSAPYVVEGCGYDSTYGGVTVVVYSPYAASFAGQMPEGGCISLSNFSTQGPGQYRIEAWQHVQNRDVVVASTSFTA